MKAHTSLCVALVFAIAAAGSPTVHAAWVQNGTVVRASSSSSNMWLPEAIADGSGGAIIAYHDYTGGYWHITAQRIDALGNLLWNTNGVPLSAGPGDQSGQQIVSDGAGGAIVVWRDTRGGDHDLYAQRVNAAGTVLWASDGVAICIASLDQLNPKVLSDGYGGAFIVWGDWRNANWDIYGQRIAANGSILWPVNGIAITNLSAQQNYPQLVSDNAGGFIVVWHDDRNGQGDIYAERMRGDGAHVWAVNGMAVCTDISGQEAPMISSDDAGGAVIAWRDTRGTGSSIYAQRLSIYGVPLWAADGIPIISDGYDNTPGPLCSSGTGEIFISWYKYISYKYDLWVQKVTRNGTLHWGELGRSIREEENDATNLVIFPDESGGIIASWSDKRSGNEDIYALRMNGSGEPLWPVNGVRLCGAIDDQNWSRLAPDGTGGGIVSWMDNRRGIFDIYAQRVTSEGYWGYPAPDIAGVRDIPGDQGGRVNISWDASRLDPGVEHAIDYYTIWRAINPTEVTVLLAEGLAYLMRDACVPLEAGARAIRIEEVAGSTYYWDLVLTADARYLASYSKVVSTLFDSTETSSEYHYFQVLAHTYDSLVFYVSEPDSGYSVDNLAPAAPLALAGTQEYTPEGLTLTWDPNTEPDLALYRIYRGTSPDFEPAPGNMIGSLADTIYFDGEWRWDSGFYYKVAAMDIHGNESGYALLAPDGITGVEELRVPEASYLAQNFPNPFNPTTRIAFGLAGPAHVSLNIYDVSGRLVRVLVNDERREGRYEEFWDGLDSSGHAVSSGIYFYKLSAGGFVETRKMALLR